MICPPSALARQRAGTSQLGLTKDAAKARKARRQALELVKKAWKSNSHIPAVLVGTKKAKPSTNVGADLVIVPRPLSEPAAAVTAKEQREKEQREQEQARRRQEDQEETRRQQEQQERAEERRAKCD
jgi:hypothetical protein